MTPENLGLIIPLRVYLVKTLNDLLGSFHIRKFSEKGIPGFVPYHFFKVSSTHRKNIINEQMSK